MQPLVSIIIPLYNAENFISETIESVLNQSYTAIEIIIVDDGSTDLSFRVAKKFENEFTTVISQPNKGASAARNRGLRLAKGEFIQFLDADDILHPNKIEHQINTLKHYSEHHLIGCNWRYFNTDINNTYKTMPFNLIETTCFNKEQWLMNRPYMIPHTWLVSKFLIERAGFWNEALSLNDDGEYFYRIIAASKGVVMDDKAMAYYRAGNPNSLSTRRTKGAMISLLESMKSYKKIMFDLMGNKANEAVDKSLFEVSYQCLNLYPDLVLSAKLEMYNPTIEYNLHDTLVFNLSKLIGLRKAKKVRDLLNHIRNTSIVNSIFFHTKKLIGREAY